MRLTRFEQNELNHYLQKYIDNPEVERMKDFIQHGSISTYEHCLRVCQASYFLDQHLHLHSNREKLVSASFLHDFFLYDWHDGEYGWKHSYNHPVVAGANAVKYFDVDSDVQRMIECHMWPLTFWRIPNCKEAWILVFADKYAALQETLFYRDIS